MEHISNGKGRRLDSWKAIAQHLDRDVRSVQRWEHERGLPVHRMPGQKTGAVFAYEAELDQWLLSRPSETPAAPEQASEPPAVPTPARWRIFPIVLFAGSLLAAAGAVFFLRTKPPEHSNTPVPAPSRAIAILPMKNLSPDAAQDYFVDGFTEELVTEIAQVRSLRVISRTSTMIYKGSTKSLPQIARDLHARYVLEGSVAREGGRVRVIAQLIDAVTDTHISARTYNGDVRDVLDIQGQIARAVAGDVNIDLSPGEKASLTTGREVDPAAHDLYLKASYAFAAQTPQSIRQSLDLYLAAGRKDPRFAPAYLGIALAELSLLQITAQTPEETFRQVKENAAKALALDPKLGDARGLLASMTYYADWNWPEAERQFHLALAEGAQAPTEQRLGSALATRGQFEDANKHLQTAIELDPLGMSPRVNWLIALLFQRKYDDVRREAERLLAAAPNFLAGHVLRLSGALGEHNCAVAADEATWIDRHFPSPLAMEEAAFAAACRGDKAAARKSLESMVASKGAPFTSPYQVALGYAAIGDKNATLKYLEKAADIREPQALYIRVEPLFDGFRTDARFVALERKLGLIP